jgi:hypothetical protein
MTAPIRSKFIVLFLMSVLCYASFFTVQCFFNFDTVNQQFAGNDNFQISNTSHHQQTVHKSTHQRSNHVKWRLNKRFQPASIPLLPYLVEAPFIVYREIDPPKIPVQFLPNALRIARLLRGPPVVA